MKKIDIIKKGLTREKVKSTYLAMRIQEVCLLHDLWNSKTKGDRKTC